MILENFYSVTNKEVIEDLKSYMFHIKINNEHEIFKGHFPGNPIMPGVCMMQIIKDLTQEIVGCQLFMRKCSNVKFMAIINPDINANLSLEIKLTHDENNEIKVRNVTKFEDTVALKLSVIYKKV